MSNRLCIVDAAHIAEELTLKINSSLISPPISTNSYLRCKRNNRLLPNLFMSASFRETFRMFIKYLLLSCFVILHMKKLRHAKSSYAMTVQRLHGNIFHKNEVSSVLSDANKAGKSLLWHDANIKPPFLVTYLEKSVDETESWFRPPTRLMSAFLIESIVE